MRWTYPNPRSSHWHLWFAWYPVRLLNTNNWVWLEMVERRCNYLERRLLGVHYRAVEGGQ